MSLDAHVVVRRPGLVLDVALEVAPGETVALVGPNGAGKSTFLHAVAGIVPLVGGHVRLGRQTWDEPARGRCLAVERRRSGLVFQEHLVFPHLSVLENVAFGLRAAGLRRREARARAMAYLERFGMAQHARRKGAELSGGQAQRVALARALVNEPQVLLLDEPMSALDERARERARALLGAEVLGGSIPVVLVTHDPADAASLADRTVRIVDGCVSSISARAAAVSCDSPTMRRAPAAAECARGLLS